MDGYSFGYQHIDDAAAAALMALEYLPGVADQEYMALLVQDPKTGLITRTDAQTQGKRNESKWTGRPGGKLAGIVHSHPAQQTGDRYPATHFSAADVSAANATKAPIYLTAIAPKGQAADARKYSPRASHKDLPRPGAEFLAQFPIEELLQHVAATRSRENPIAAAIIQAMNNGNSRAR